MGVDGVHVWVRQEVEQADRAGSLGQLVEIQRVGVGQIDRRRCQGGGSEGTVDVDQFLDRSPSHGQYP